MAVAVVAVVMAVLIASCGTTTALQRDDSRLSTGTPSANGAGDSVGAQHLGPVTLSSVTPDPSRPDITAAVLRVDPRQVRLRLIAGRKEPGHGTTGTGMIPLADQPRLLAAFNSGFKMRDSNGGWYDNGTTVVPLRTGAASLALRDDRTAQVGTWGTDVVMDAHVVAVRQNLTLLVDKKNPTPLVSATDFALAWGKTIHRLPAVWRSGIGITTNGALVYVAGSNLTVSALAQALIAAGAQRAMELDINTQFVNAFTYAPGTSGPVGHKLLRTLRYGPDHYLQPQDRDLIEVLSR